jgi:hypothetical protein
MPANRLILLSLLAAAPVAWVGGAEAARLEVATGSVQARGQGDWMPAGSGLALDSGGAIRTGGESRAVATLPGAVLGLEPASHLDLVRVGQAPQVILARGSLSLVVEAAPVALQVATPRGVAEILRPGRYLIEAGDAVRPTRLSVVDGAARLVTGEGATPAEAGQVAWVALDNVVRMGPVGLAAQAVAWPVVPPPAPAPVAAPVVETAAAPVPAAVAPASAAAEAAPATVAPAVAATAAASAATRVTSSSRSAARVAPAPARPAVQAAARPAAQAGPRPPARTAPRPSVQTAPRAATQTAPRAATQTAPRTGTQAAPRAGTQAAPPAPAPATPTAAAAGTPPDRPS